MDSALREKPPEKSETEKREAELMQELTRRGLIDGRHQVVDISKANKAYLPKEEWKAKKISWNEFFRIYKTENWSLKPKEFVNELYKKPSYKEGAALLGGEVAVPVYEGGLTLGTPSVRGGVGIQETRGGQAQWKIETGIEQTDISSSPKPFVEASGWGFFAHIGSAIKGVAVGIAEGIFNIGAQIVGGVKYLVSATLGPWVGNINVVTGAIGGTFSWLLMGFEMGSNAIKRAFADQNEFFSDQHFDRIKEGTVIAGTDERNKVKKATVSKIIKQEEKEIRFLDEKGKEHTAEADGNGVRVYDYAGFGTRLGRALNPVTLVKDAYNAAVVKPIYKLKDTYDGFRNPSAGEKLDKAGIEKTEERMWEAHARGDFSTARYNARLLVQSTSGEKKAEYMLALDTIEWAVGNQGLFVGYISGLGFGNRRNMVDASIEKRVKESINAIEKAEPGSPEFMCAQKYIAGKAQFRGTAAGKRVPRSYSPERLQNDITDSYVKADERMSTHIMAPGRGDVNFRGGIQINKDDPERARKEKFMEFLQAAYEKMPERHGDMDRLYDRFWHDNYREKQDAIAIFYKDFIAKAGPVLDGEISSLSEREIKAAYNEWRPQKKA